MELRKCRGLKGKLVTVKVGQHVRISRTASFGTNVVLGDNTGIGTGSQIEDGCRISETQIGKDCRIGSRSEITLCTFGDKVSIDSGALCSRLIVDRDVEIGTDLNASSWSATSKFSIGRHATIGDHVYFSSRVTIGERVEIGNCVHLDGADLDSWVRVGDSCYIKGRVGQQSRIGDQTRVQDSIIGSWCQIGDWVLVRPGVTIPQGWLIPSDTVVNPARPTPVVLYNPKHDGLYRIEET